MGEILAMLMREGRGKRVGRSEYAGGGGGFVLMCACLVRPPFYDDSAG